jgi:hypothetical protein
MSESVKLPEPVAHVAVNVSGGNAGIAWRGVPSPDAPFLVKDGEPLYTADQLTAAHAAGVRAGMLRAAQIAEAEEVDAAGTGNDADAAYNLACEHIAAAIRAEAGEGARREQ